jgi:hypothetical protein
MIAVKRLTDQGVLAEVVRDSQDWVLRRFAVSMILSVEALVEIASKDPDGDVRLEALLRLRDDGLVARVALSAAPLEAREGAVEVLSDQDILSKIAMGGDAKSVRLLAIRRLADRRLLAEVARTAGDAGLRAEALARAAQAEGEVPDPKNVQVRHILLDPALRNHYGELELAFRLWTEEKRYVKEDEDLSEPQPKGKVLVENVSLAIRRGDEVLFEKSYRGNRPRKAEPFAPGYPREGGYLVKVNAADIDYLEICRALLKPLGGEQLALAARSENKYVRTAAASMVNP